MASKPSVSDELSYLLNGAAWQDSLMQSYRSLHLTFQSILLAVGIGLVVVVLSFEEPLPVGVLSIIFLAVWALQMFSMKRFKSIVTFRGQDVNFWHRAIILAENGIPAEKRYFTEFKVYQRQRPHQKDLAHLKEKFLSEYKISPEETDLLIEKGLGHTRRVIDQQLFAFISWIWIFLLIAILVMIALQIFAA
jgi:Flp pilus assembly protein TadB